MHLKFIQNHVFIESGFVCLRFLLFCNSILYTCETERALPAPGRPSKGPRPGSLRMDQPAACVSTNEGHAPLRRTVTVVVGVVGVAVDEQAKPKVDHMLAAGAQPCHGAFGDAGLVVVQGAEVSAVLAKDFE